MASYSELFCRGGHDLSIRGLRKSYSAGDRNFQALNGISCDIPKGRVTTIQGPSGCGKTTLLNIIGGVDLASTGSVVVGGIEITEGVDERALAQYRLNEVGFVFQAFNLIPGLTALENLQLPMVMQTKDQARRIERCRELLQLVGIEDKADKKPDQLSSGEQQRVAIALALVNDPPLILADEPTGNLDRDNAEKVFGLLCALAHEYGKTAVVTTHDSLIGDRGDQRLNIRDGVLEQ